MIRAIRCRFRVVAGRRASDRGLSLVELLVAMTLFSLVLAMVVGFFVSASKATQLTTQIDGTNRQATTAMDEVSRIIRGATTNPVATAGSVPSPAFTVAGTNTITLYSAVNLSSSTAQNEIVQFSIDANSNLVEKVWQPITSNGYFTFGSSPTTSRIIAGPLVLTNAGGPNLFTYINSAGTAIATSGGAVASTDIASIAAVQVSLQVGTANTAAQSTLLTDSVGLPNLQIARNPS